MSSLGSSLVITLSVSLFALYNIRQWLYTISTTHSTNYRLIALRKKGKSATLNDIPGPVGYPLVGMLPAMYPYVKKFRVDLYYSDLAEKYQGVCKIQSNSRTQVLVNDAAIAAKIFKSPDMVRSDFLSMVMLDVAPSALFVIPTGNQWKIHRKALQPAFGPVHLREAFSTSLAFVDKLLAIWEKSTIRDVAVDFSFLTGDVICKVAFALDLKGLESLSEKQPLKFFEHFEKTMSILERRFAVSKYKFLWGLLGISESKINPSIEFIGEKLTEAVKKRREELQNDTNASKIERGDILDRLLSASFTESEIFSELFGFFLAGYETTSNTLTWALLELVKNPHVYEKLFIEVDTALKGNELTLDTLNSLKYLDCVFKETMRLHSVVKVQGRQTTKHCEFVDSEGLKFLIPPGVQMSANIGWIQMSEIYWGPDAKIFNPDRWSNGFIPIPGSYLPFSDGQHNCIGQKLATIETKVALVRIAQKFKELKISPMQGPIEPVTKLTHGLKNGLILEIVER